MCYIKRITGYSSVWSEHSVFDMKCFFCENDFSLSGQGSGGMNRMACFDCMPSGLDRKSRQKKRDELLYNKAKTEKINSGCSICGYNKCCSALEWHHPEDDKLYNPSSLLNTSWERYQKETEKCVLLCSNCHREEHEKTNSV